MLTKSFIRNFEMMNNIHRNETIPARRRHTGQPGVERRGGVCAGRVMLINNVCLTSANDAVTTTLFSHLISSQEAPRPQP